MKYTRKQKEQVKELLNLDKLPDEEFMRLLDAANAAAESPQPAGPTAKRMTPSELESITQAATASELLRRAKKASRRTFAQVGEQLGVSRQRAAEIVRSDNMELDTLVRTAAAMGYELRVVLHPVDHQGQDLTSVLPSGRGADRDAVETM